MSETLASPPRESSLAPAISRLRSAGLRVTHPRIALLTVLIEAGRPETIEQLHARLRGKSDCDLVTVYRCMAAFEKLNLVRRLYEHNGTSLWQYLKEGDSPYLLVSKSGGTTEPLDTTLSGELAAAMQRVEAVLKSRGYTDVSHKLQFFVKTQPAAS